MSDHEIPRRVLLTGASGFVGGYVLRELLAKGHEPVCLARSPSRLFKRHPALDFSRIVVVEGDLFDRPELTRAATGCQAVIHLVGIILENRLTRQSFERIHVAGTRAVLEAAQSAGARRFVHMSALGSRPDAVSRYHQTKFRAEEALRAAGLDWTIFRPSVIHGPDGEFMALMKTFQQSWMIPMIPVFGKGDSFLQPVSVRDVAYCFVESLRRPETIGRTFALCGPQRLTWRQLYETCRDLIPKSKKWKKIAGLPLPVAKLMAITVMKTPLVPPHLKYNRDQIIMSQENSICDSSEAESAFDMKFKSFRDELAAYADQMG